MPYTAQIYPVLVSCPSDVATDVDAVVEAVIRWNAVYGRKFGAAGMPLYWGSHAAAEYGHRPQKALNDQLVEQADIVIALFWHRLGTGTGVARSGTVEEIEEAHARGARVAILRCTRSATPDEIEADQLKELNSYLADIQDKALILEYAHVGQLKSHVENVLTQAASSSAAQAKAEVVDSPLGVVEAAQVWPTLDRRESSETDSKGRLKTKNRWYLVLSNTGQEPAKNVDYALEPDGDGDVPMDMGDGGALEQLPPGAKTEVQLHLHSGVASRARCTVTWTDSQGRHENLGTLRFF